MNLRKFMNKVQDKYGAGTGRAGADSSNEPLDATQLIYTSSTENRVVDLREDFDYIAALERERHENNSRTQEPPRDVTEDRHDHVPRDAQRNSAEETAENERANMVGQEERRMPFDARGTSHQTCPPYQPPNPFLPGHAEPFTSEPYVTRHHAQECSTAVRGHQTSYTGSVINVDSGNTTTHTVTNSNNDSSIATYSRRGRRD